MFTSKTTTNDSSTVYGGVLTATGTTGVISYIDTQPNTIKLDTDSIDIDALWEKMYTKAKAVIVTCSHCNSHNAISNPTCVQCGAPLGYSK